MLEFKATLVLLLCLVPGSLSISSQVPLAAQPWDADDYAKPRRKLQGRFLHITDMHPDPHYRVGASEKKACHRGKPKKGKRAAGYYGLSYSDCDAPLSLTNYTLDFLGREWADDIDFVIWTGDSARHDNDRKHPRTTSEIYGLNRAMAKKMEEVFARKGIPVVPTIGNNDVWPHNIMMPGPNGITSEFSSIWRAFVPFPAYQVFQRGGYFSVEVIPSSVAVISLNTMYFYDSNAAVGGCEHSEPQDPGNLHFDWLDVQLETFRSRKMQVWLTGHVPPSPRNYFPECYVRYVELSLRYQDTILGHLYGHMNMDHFFLLDANQLSRPRNMSSTSDNGISTLKQKKKELYKTLMQEFSDLPKYENLDHDNYGVVNVAPPVVPTYLPSFRIFTYNTTGEPYEPGHLGEDEQPGRTPRSMKDVAGPLCADEAYENTWRCKLTQPWHSSPRSPSRRNTLWTPLGYAQYYLPDLEGADEEHRPKFKLEYLTLPASTLHPPPDDAPESENETAMATSAGRKFDWPIPKRHLPRSLRNSTTTKSKKFAPYTLDDLTIPSWTGLAKRLGRNKGKLRQRFKEFMYMGGEPA
ncbi:Metallo-dependent phosphatase-like protein [Dichomitus squalens]|uniref:Endopolyphosphatase n=1 Tax=Dichomitus squalens TaxID=114155 RepID=A0A4Q9PBM7_9APHY|nr:Metallo-dependent phosphatase-like protein [Dichomitus squalens]TBU59100.1 Metallo-dependent phosphatase-like protein [Dichomitus squalens]